MARAKKAQTGAIQVDKRAEAEREASQFLDSRELREAVIAACAEQAGPLFREWAPHPKQMRGSEAVVNCVPAPQPMIEGVGVSSGVCPSGDATDVDGRAGGWRLHCRPQHSDWGCCDTSRDGGAFGIEQGGVVSSSGGGVGAAVANAALSSTGAAVLPVDGALAPARPATVPHSRVTHCDNHAAMARGGEALAPSGELLLPA